jgi:ketosteroid isomerase-like protein
LAWMSCNLTSIHSADRKTIITSMQRQQDAWNHGDIEMFMSSYWKSDSLMFIGKKGVTLGWNETLLNYKKSYPDKESMGQLKFSNLDIFPEGNAFVVVGKWELFRVTDTLSGYYTLLWKKIGDEWLIVKDHSS